MSSETFIRLVAAGSSSAFLLAAVIFLRAGRKASEATLPEPWYGGEDRIQYFAPGSEFELTREAAAQSAPQAKHRSGQR